MPMRFLAPFVLTVMSGVAPAQTIGMNSWIHATANLDRTFQFYFEAFGLESPAPPRPPNPAVPALLNVPGAKLQVAMLRFPGSPFGFELTGVELTNGGSGIELHPDQPHPWDPGAARLIVEIPNIDAALAALKKAGASVVTRSGVPVKMRDARIVVVRDPDGYLIELVESLEPGASMGLAVRDIQETAKFYHEMLGFDLRGLAEFQSDQSLSDAFDLPSPASHRIMTAMVPGTKALMLFWEFKRLNGAAFRRQVSDPGTPAMALRVSDLDGLLRRLKAAGTPVISAGGIPVQFSPTIRNIFVEDPNGFKLELYEQK
jgi:catechol 2,3-dioxygenase-like lactoylglutathione lyase family enzyme